MNKTWTTKDGEKIAYKDLTDRHLMNILRFMKRRAKEGVRKYYCHGFDLEELDVWDETVYDDEALEELGYYELLEEVERRGLGGLE